MEWICIEYSSVNVPKGTSIRCCIEDGCSYLCTMGTKEFSCDIRVYHFDLLGYNSLHTVYTIMRGNLH